MLVLACHDLGRLVTTADLAAAMSVEALLGTDRVFADDLQQLRPQPGQAVSAANMRAVLAGSPIVSSHAGPEDTRVQDAYSLRCAPQVAGRLPRHHRPRRAGSRRRARVGDRQPGRAARRPGRVQRQLPRRAGRLRPGLPRDRRRRPGVDLGAAYRSDARPQPVARPAAVPGRRARRRLGPHDRAVHPGRDGQRVQAARGAGERRLDPVLGDAGGPRVDGLVGGAQAAAVARPASAGCSRSRS